MCWLSLTPIWTVKTETASRVHQRLETIFDWVIAQGWRLDNPAGKPVIRALPRVSRLKSHHRALPPADVPAALKMVRESNSDPATRLAFEFLVLTAARSNEVRQATWLEMDLENAVWAVPAMHMKARREHWVPLSRRSLEILDQARELAREDEGLVFPANRSGKAHVRHDVYRPVAAVGHPGRTPRVPQQLQELVQLQPRRPTPSVFLSRGGVGPQPGQRH